MSDRESERPGHPNWESERRDERRQWRQDRREMRRLSGPFIGAVVLIVLGVLFLLRNFGLRLPANWWAFFLLIPAFGAFAGAWRAYDANGRHWTAAVASLFFGGMAFLLLAAALFFGVDWGRFWPVILIVIGVGLLARGWWSR